MNIINLFDHIVRCNNSSIAVKYKEQFITYQELDNLSNQYAQVIIDYC